MRSETKLNGSLVAVCKNKKKHTANSVTATVASHSLTLPRDASECTHRYHRLSSGGQPGDTVLCDRGQIRSFQMYVCMCVWPVLLRWGVGTPLTCMWTWHVGSWWNEIQEWGQSNEAMKINQIVHIWKRKLRSLWEERFTIWPQVMIDAVVVAMDNVCRDVAEKRWRAEGTIAGGQSRTLVQALGVSLMSMKDRHVSGRLLRDKLDDERWHVFWSSAARQARWRWKTTGPEGKTLDTATAHSLSCGWIYTQNKCCRYKKKHPTTSVTREFTFQHESDRHLSRFVYKSELIILRTEVIHYILPHPISRMKPRHVQVKLCIPKFCLSSANR